jgi:hypothetical protein
MVDLVISLFDIAILRNHGYAAGNSLGQHAQLRVDFGRREITPPCLFFTALFPARAASLWGKSFRRKRLRNICDSWILPDAE